MKIYNVILGIAIILMMANVGCAQTSAWAPSTSSFTTLPDPLPPVTMSVLTVSAVTNKSAVVNGVLSGQAADVTVYYGTADGGTNAASWGYSLVLGKKSIGAFSATLPGLKPATKYYARGFAVNATSGASGWAPSSGAFDVPIGIILLNSPSGKNYKTITSSYYDYKEELIALDNGHVSYLYFVGNYPGNVQGSLSGSGFSGGLTKENRLIPVGLDVSKGQSYLLVFKSTTGISMVFNPGVKSYYYNNGKWSKNNFHPQVQGIS